MNSDNFWVSADGTVTAQRDLRPGLLELSLAFPTKGRAELGFLRKRLQNLQFSERSRLARAGIEVRLTGKLEVKRRRITATAEAFVIDEGFPSNRCFRKLLRPGTPVGRLFFPSASAKLNSTEIWEAITANRIKLPNTISIDRFGKVYFTPPQTNLHPARHALGNRFDGLGQRRAPALFPG